MGFKTKRSILTAAIFAAFILIIFGGGCRQSPPAKQSGLPLKFTTYREIPGVTDDEIAAVSRLADERAGGFVYGAILSTEMFHDRDNGGMRGYTAMLCEWLTGLFGIEFKPAAFEWGDLAAGLESGVIDFTGDMTPTDERRQKYLMTDAIAQRTLKYFRISGSRPLSDIAEEHAPRFAFFRGTTTPDYVAASHIYDNFETIYVSDTAEAYRLLKDRKADAFLDESVFEAAFDIYGNVVTTDFFPLLNNPVVMTAFKPELAPVISVVQKALQNGGSLYLAELYKRGEQMYHKHKLDVTLTEEERAYIRDNPVIPIAAETYVYPISFYNKYEKDWQGIYFDVLDEVTYLTGLVFKPVNGTKAEFPELLELLESGGAFMMSEVIQTEERANRGLMWTNVPTMVDRYALLSKSEFPNVSLRGVLDVRVGVPRQTAYADLFRSWFPNHRHIVEYESTDAAFEAMERGEVDLVISSLRRLLSITNYNEFSGYKANLVFDRISESFFAFNKDQAVLRSIINKTLTVIDIRGISEQWSLKTYNYKGKVAQAQRPWLIGASALLVCVLVLLIIMQMRRRSEGKRLEILVQKRTAEAQAANRAKSAFLANMSHEIRTPLNAIIGMAAICRAAKDIEKKDYALGKIEGASAHLLGVVNDVLDMSKIEANKLELSNVQYDFRKMLDKMITVINFRVDEKHQKLLIEVDDAIPRVLVGDDQRLSQVIMNLLSNAVKFTPDGGEIRINAALAGEANGICELRIEVADSGIGISAEQQAQLFSAFKQAESGTSRKFGGTGLGLAISKRIVEMMGGKIWIESELGKGARFIFTVKAKHGEDLPDSEPREDAGAQEASRENAFAGKRLLLAEDMEVNREIIITLLDGTGLAIDSAENGEIALAAITAAPDKYDAILMDVQMPHMDGLEATRRIRALPALQNKKLPIIAMTANVFKEDIDMCIAAGMDDHLGKPLDFDDMLTKLRKYLFS